MKIFDPKLTDVISNPQTLGFRSSNTLKPQFLNTLAKKPPSALNTFKEQFIPLQMAKKQSKTDDIHFDFSNQLFFITLDFCDNLVTLVHVLG